MEKLGRSGKDRGASRPTSPLRRPDLLRALTDSGLAGIVRFYAQDSPELVEARSPVGPRRLAARKQTGHPQPGAPGTDTRVGHPQPSNWGTWVSSCSLVLPNHFCSRAAAVPSLLHA